MDDLYFISCADSIKIGRTKDVWKRMQAMQSNTPFEIDCIARLTGRGYEEPAWHAAFCESRGLGEWFRDTEELREAIDLARNGEEWWNHLAPPARFFRDKQTDMRDEDDVLDTEVDWHIGILLFCHELKGRLSADQTIQ